MSNPLTGEQASLREQVKAYLEHEEAPAAYELLEAQSHLLQSDDLQLLYCEVLLRIGRFEKVEELARRILESDPTNDSAAYFLQLVSSATVKPSNRTTTDKERPKTLLILDAISGTSHSLKCTCTSSLITCNKPSLRAALLRS